MIELTVWIGLCALVAIAGNGKNIGYWGVFFLSLILSPLIGLIIALCSKDEEKPKKTYKCKHCQLVTEINSYYCPRCLKDSDGFTAEINAERLKNS